MYFPLKVHENIANAVRHVSKIIFLGVDVNRYQFSGKIKEKTKKNKAKLWFSI